MEAVKCLPCNSLSLLKEAYQLEQGGDCGCGGPKPQAMPPAFVPPTPPIYSAPYTGPANVAQPPYMNPYGMGPMDGMMRYDDESNEYDF